MGQKLVSRATYWRRRVVVLAAGVAVLGLPIWAVNAALGGSRAPGLGSPRPDAGHVASAHSRGHGHQQTPAGDTADLGSRPRARPSAVPRGASASPSPGPGQQTCARRAVRLTLRSARYRYRYGEQVTFVVGAVSTRSLPCRLDLGSKFTSVVVASSGTPLWDSSSCLRGSGFWVVTLRRDTPAFLRITWDRRTSLSGCPGQGAAVRPGTYTAAAFNGRIHSRATTFVLSGRGAARP
ncbi:MAG TPA: hypothetical protein VFJ07_01545 [Streptosporangiaceae bacterium]|nr:hypothetical protein [Streptosporangiaceae bacterium]